VELSTDPGGSDLEASRIKKLHTIVEEGILNISAIMMRCASKIYLLDALDGEAIALVSDRFRR
jgi:hypothetical protein